MVVRCLFCGRTLNTAAKTIGRFTTSFGTVKVHKACIPNPAPEIKDISFFRKFFGGSYDKIAEAFLNLWNTSIRRRVALRRVKDLFNNKYSETMISLFEQALYKERVTKITNPQKPMTVDKSLKNREITTIKTAPLITKVSIQTKIEHKSKVNVLNKINSIKPVEIDLWDVSDKEREEVLDNVTAGVVKTIPVYGDVALMRRCISIVKGPGEPKSAFIYPSKGRYIVTPSPNSVFFFVEPITFRSNPFEKLENVWIEHRTEYIERMQKKAYPDKPKVESEEIKPEYSNTPWDKLPEIIKTDFIIWSEYAGYRKMANPEYSCEKCGTLLPIDSILAGLLLCPSCRVGRYVKSDLKGLMVCCEKCGTNFIAYSRESVCPICNKLVSTRNLRLLYDSLRVRKPNPEDDLPNAQICSRCGYDIAFPGHELCWHCLTHQRKLIQRRDSLMKKNTYDPKRSWVSMSSEERYNALRSVCQPSEAKKYVLKPWNTIPSGIRMMLSEKISGEKLFWHFKRGDGNMANNKLGIVCARCGFSIVDKPQFEKEGKKYCKTCYIIIKNPMERDKRPPKELFARIFPGALKSAEKRWPELPKEVKAFYETPERMTHALLGKIWYQKIHPETKMKYEKMRRTREKIEARTGKVMPYPHNNPVIRIINCEMKKMLKNSKVVSSKNYAEYLMNTGEGAATGSAIGAAIGTVIEPGGGTALGAAAGSAIGGAIEELTKPKPTEEKKPDAPKTNPMINKKIFLNYINKLVSGAKKVGKRYPGDKVSDLVDMSNMHQMAVKTFRVLEYAKDKEWISRGQFDDLCVLLDIVEEKALKLGQDVNDTVNKKNLDNAISDLKNLVDIAWPSAAQVNNPHLYDTKYFKRLGNDELKMFHGFAMKYGMPDKVIKAFVSEVKGRFGKGSPFHKEVTEGMSMVSMRHGQHKVLQALTKKLGEKARKNPYGRALTIKQAKALRLGDHLYHRRLRNRDGTPMRFKVNGKPRTWKRQPGHVVISLKHGLWSYLSIHEGEFKDFTLGK